MVEPAEEEPDVVIQAIAARSQSRAETFARHHRIPHVAEDYAALIARDDIDLVYIPLPPSEHLHWTREAVQAGKHVLCEKPFALNASEAAEMVAVAQSNGRHLIEAFHYRFHPLIERLKELMIELGPIQRVIAKFCVPIPHLEGELRYIAGLGGGALMDLGCYPLHLCRSLLDEEPEIASAEARWHKTGVDQAMAARLAFPSGAIASIFCSMECAPAPKILAEIQGANGKLQVNNYVAPHMFHSIKLETKRRRWKGRFASKSTYAHQLDHVVKVLRGLDQPITGGNDAIATMHAIDAIYALARR